MRALAAVLLAMALLGLGGCVHQRTATGSATDATLRDVAQSFGLQGKLAVSNAGKGYNAAVRWDQDGELADITLNGPVGIGRTRLIGTSRQIRILSASGESIVYDDPARALLEQIGWSMPLDALKYWVVGVPAPALGATALPAQSQGPGARRWRQAGWQIEVNELGAYEAGALPRKLTFVRGATRLRLVVSNWQVPLPPR